MNSQSHSHAIALKTRTGTGLVRALLARLRPAFRRRPPVIPAVGWSEHMLRDVGLTDHLARRPRD